LLTDALVSGFAPAELEVFVRERLNTDLFTVIERGPGRVVAFRLVGWAERGGQTCTLAAALAAARPDNRFVQEVATQVRTWCAVQENGSAPGPVAPPSRSRPRRDAFSQGYRAYLNWRRFRAVQDCLREQLARSASPVPAFEEVAEILNLPLNEVINPWGYDGVFEFDDHEVEVLSRLASPDLTRWRRDCQGTPVPVPDTPSGPVFAGFARAMAYELERQGPIGDTTDAPFAGAINDIRDRLIALRQAALGDRPTVSQEGDRHLRMWEDRVAATEGICLWSAAQRGARPGCRDGQCVGPSACAVTSPQLAGDRRLLRTWRTFPSAPRTVVPAVNEYTLALLGEVHSAAREVGLGLEHPRNAGPAVDACLAQCGERLTRWLLRLLLEPSLYRAYLVRLVAVWGRAFLAVRTDVLEIIPPDRLPFRLPLDPDPEPTV
jgi:hypothetical protein